MSRRVLIALVLLMGNNFIHFDLAAVGSERITIVSVEEQPACLDSLSEVWKRYGAPYPCIEMSNEIVVKVPLVRPDKSIQKTLLRANNEDFDLHASDSQIAFPNKRLGLNQCQFYKIGLDGIESPMGSPCTFILYDGSKNESASTAEKKSYSIVVDQSQASQIKKIFDINTNPIFLEIADHQGKFVETSKSFESSVRTADLSFKEAEILANYLGPDRLLLNTMVHIEDVQANPESWGLDRIDQWSLPLDRRFDNYNLSGLGTEIYVIDSGLNFSHSEFIGRVPRSAYLSSLGSAVDCDGHGTHVAGSAMGTKFGVAKKANVIPVRVFGCSGGTSWANIVAAMEWVISDHDLSDPAVVNMSLGGSSNSWIDDTVQDMINDGIVVVVSAGNDGGNACSNSPARAPNAITVGSTTVQDLDSSFSNIGPCVDIFAPGSSIKSAWIGNSTSTQTISGTSMAAPHVTGVAAILLELKHDGFIDKSQTNAFIRKTLVNNAIEDTLKPCCGATSWWSNTTNKLLSNFTDYLSSAPPTITGSAAVNQTLTVVKGTWSGSPTPSLKYQWHSCSDNSLTTSCSVITGATATTFRPTAAQSGKYIRVLEIATNAITSNNIYSEATAAVGMVPTLSSGTLTITGTASVGSTLTMNNSLVWSGSPVPTESTQWYRCTSRISSMATTVPSSCSAISGASSATYVLTSDDSGKFVTVGREATSTAGTARRISPSTATAIGQAPTNISAPTITGSAAVNQTLTVVKGTWSGSPTPSLKYQWHSCSDNSLTTSCSVITGATATTFRPTAAQSGKYIRVLEIATNAITSNNIYSEATAAVGMVPTLSSGTLTITGTASVGSTLTMNNSLVWSGSPVPTESTQWYRCTSRISSMATTVPSSCSAISGASSATYVLTSDDSGKFVTVGREATSTAGTARRISPSTATAIGQAPTNISAPTITGSAAVNQTLTVVKGTWSGSPTPSLKYQWHSCSDNSLTTSCSVITGATATTFRPTAAQSGKYIRVLEIATNAITSNNIYSEATAAVGMVPTLSSGTLTITGTASVGSTLTMNNSLVWSGSPVPTESTQWYRCTSRISSMATTVPSSCSAISGASSATYVLTSDDSGKFVTVGREATSTAGTARRISPSTATAIGQAPTNISAPTITGSAAVNQTLTVVKGTWSGSPTPSLKYQWHSCSDNSLTTSCSVITGATATTFRPTAAQSGKYIRVLEIATNAITSNNIYSEATAAVGMVPTLSSGTLTITGTASVGSTLTMNNSLVWSGSPVPTESTQWYRCTSRISSMATTVPSSCSAISGASSATYVLTSDDSGKFVTVGREATSTAGTARRISPSTATAIVGG